MGIGLAVCVACGSTASKRGPDGVGAAGQGAGGEGLPDSGGANGIGGDQAGAGNAATGGGPVDADGGEAGMAGGGGKDAGVAGDGGAPEPACRPALPVKFRDFKPYGVASGHDDFEISARGVKNQDGSTYEGWTEVGCGLVEPSLGAEGKPRVFAGAADTQSGVTLPGIVGRRQRVVAGAGCWTPANPTPPGDCVVSACQPWAITPPTYSVKGASTFEQWFNTVEGVSIELAGELVLNEAVPGSATWRFDSDAFFPLDGAGFGNSPGLAHNYSFTTESRVSFTYLAGQKFAFRGDDDLWIFVNGKLALDLGGTHQPLTGTIDLDAQAATLGITPGNTYQLDLFHAERQSPSSSFHVSTNIACFEPR